MRSHAPIGQASRHARRAPAPSHAKHRTYLDPNPWSNLVLLALGECWPAAARDDALPVHSAHQPLPSLPLLPPGKPPATTTLHCLALGSPQEWLSAARIAGRAAAQGMQGAPRRRLGCQARQLSRPTARAHLSRRGRARPGTQAGMQKESKAGKAGIRPTWKTSSHSEGCGGVQEGPEGRWPSGGEGGQNSGSSSRIASRHVSVPARARRDWARPGRSGMSTTTTTHSCSQLWGWQAPAGVRAGA